MSKSNVRFFQSKQLKKMNKKKKLSLHIPQTATENIESMISCMNSEKVPDGHSSCENCAYARQRSVYDNI